MNEKSEHSVIILEVIKAIGANIFLLPESVEIEKIKMLKISLRIIKGASWNLELRTAFSRRIHYINSFISITNIFWGPLDLLD